MNTYLAGYIDNSCIGLTDQNNSFSRFSKECNNVSEVAIKAKSEYSNYKS
jgi:hypothetical protein